MPQRQRKPTSPGRRFQTVADFSEITKTTPERTLVEKKSPPVDVITMDVKRHVIVEVDINRSTG